MGHIETELHRRGDLIHILAAGAGGADELLMNFFLIDRDRTGNPNHALSVPRIQKCRYKIPRTGYSGCHSAISKIHPHRPMMLGCHPKCKSRNELKMTGQEEEIVNWLCLTPFTPI